MNLKDLRLFVIEKSKKYPILESEIWDFYYLCLDEIDEGNSVDNEISLCLSSIKQLIEDEGQS